MLADIRYSTIGIALAITLGWISICGLLGNLGTLVPVAVLGMASIGYVLWRAAQRQRWALLAVLSGVLILLDVVFLSRDKGEPGLDAQNGMKLLGWIGLLGVCALNLPEIKKSFRDPAILAFGCYLGICLLSTLYSEVRLVTSTAALGMIAYLGFACLIVHEIDERTLYINLFWTLAAFCILNLLSVIALPDVAFFHVDIVREPDNVRLQGVSGHPNQLGRAASLFLMITMIVAWRGYVRILWVILFSLIGLLLTVWSGSRTAILGVIFALILQLHPRGYILLLVGALGLVAGGIIAAGDLNSILSLVGREGDASEALTMSGRADLWDFTLRLIQERPVIGWGFNSFESLASIYWSGANSAAVVATHNNFLSVLFATGLVGLSAFVTGFGILLYRWLRYPSFARDFFVINILFESFSESGALSLIAPMTTLILLMVILMEDQKAYAT